MPLEDYLLGFADLIAVLAGVAFATRIVVRRRYGHLSGATRLLAGALIGMAGLILVHLLPGMLGVLTRGTVLIATVAVAVASTRIPAADRGPADPEPGGAPGTAGAALPFNRFSWVIAAMAVTVVGAYFIAFLVAQGTLAVHGFDSTNFHLPTVARWIQTGSFWQVDSLVPGWAFGQYPNNGNVIQLAFIMPWRNDAFIRYLNLPFMALSAVSVYALATELGARRPAAATFAAVAVAVPTSAVVSLDNSMTDAMLQPMFAIGVLFLVRYARTRRPAELALGGLGLGLAMGTKWYGLPYAIAAIAVWAVGEYLWRRDPRRVLRATALLAGWTLVAGGFWLLRNLVLSGNPLFPQRLTVLGVTVLSAPPDRILSQYGFSLAHYIGSPHVLVHTVLPNFKYAFGLAGALVALGTAAAFALAWSRRRRGPAGERRLPGRVVALAAGTVIIVLIYFVTPYSAQGPAGNPYLMGAAARYAMPAVLTAGALTAWASGRLGRWSWVAELAALLTIIDSIRRYRFFGNFGFRPISSGDVLIGLALLAVCVALPVAVTAWRRREPARGRMTPALASALAALALLGGAGWLHQRAFNRVRYRHYDATFDWVLNHAASGHRVGLAAGASSGYNSPTLVMFGPRFRNVVKFVGPTYQGLLEEYHQPAPFVAALRRGRFDLLLVGKRPGETAVPHEVSWARGAGFATIAQSNQYTLMRLSG